MLQTQKRPNFVKIVLLMFVASVAFQAPLFAKDKQAKEGSGEGTKDDTPEEVRILSTNEILELTKATIANVGTLTWEKSGLPGIDANRVAIGKFQFTPLLNTTNNRKAILPNDTSRLRLEPIIFQSLFVFEDRRPTILAANASEPIAPIFYKLNTKDQPYEALAINLNVSDPEFEEINDLQIQLIDKLFKMFRKNFYFPDVVLDPTQPTKYRSARIASVSFDGSVAPRRLLVFFENSVDLKSFSLNLDTGELSVESYQYMSAQQTQFAPSLELNSKPTTVTPIHVRLPILTPYKDPDQVRVFLKQSRIQHLVKDLLSEHQLYFDSGVTDANCSYILNQSQTIQ